MPRESQSAARPRPSSLAQVRPPIARADLIAGMAKGLAVLESFDVQRQRLNATLAAERAGLTRAAARRHLLTLAHLGYLETDGSYFWLAPKVLGFSGSYLATSRLPRAVQPTLNRLAAQTGESFSVAVLDGAEVVIVGRSGHEGANTAAAGRFMAHGLHLGARLPAHATSTGHVLLAALSRAELSRWMQARLVAGSLPRLTLHTPTEPQQLRRLLDEVRRQDHALASQMHELGVQALAVPLRDAQGRTVAALNVVTSPARLPAQALARERLPLLQDAARELRSLL